MMPKYIRTAMRDCIRLEEVSGGENRFLSDGGEANVETPETPMVIFINRKSGGRLGPKLKERLQYLMGEEQVTYLLDMIFFLLYIDFI